MAVAEYSPMLRHAASAKRLLAALQRHADATMSLVGGDTPTEFFAALNERDRLLAELNGVVEAITRERAVTRRDRETQIAIVKDIVQTATAALASLPIAALLPLLVLAGVFEAVFALHTGVERIGRYIQVFFEAPGERAWEHTAMAFGRAFPGSRRH